MTLILKLDLNMVKMYHHTKSQVSMSRHSKVIAQTDRQIDRQTVWKHYLPAYAGGKDVKKIFRYLVRTKYELSGIECWCPLPKKLVFSFRYCIYIVSISFLAYHICFQFRAVSMWCSNMKYSNLCVEVTDKYRLRIQWKCSHCDEELYCPSSNWTFRHITCNV